MTEPMTVLPGSDRRPRGLQAADFLLQPEEFVSQCIAAFDGTAETLTTAQRAVLAEAIRAGRPRIDIVEAIGRYTSLGAASLLGKTANGVSLNWGDCIVTDQLVKFAPGDDVIFAEQVYKQALHRSPTSIEAIEAKFDLKGGLSRIEFIERIARRSSACRLDTDTLPAGLGAAISDAGKIRFSFVEPTRDGGWVVARDVHLQAAPTVDGYLQLDNGWVLSGPKADFPSGKWHLTIDLVQPEAAHVIVDVVANAGLDVLASFELAGPARLTAGFSIEPWHHFIEVRLSKDNEPQPLRQLKLRELVLRQA